MKASWNISSQCHALKSRPGVVPPHLFWIIHNLVALRIQVEHCIVRIQELSKPIIISRVAVPRAQDVRPRRISEPELHQYTIISNLGRDYLPTNAPKAPLVLV